MKLDFYFPTFLRQALNFICAAFISCLLTTTVGQYIYIATFTLCNLKTSSTTTSFSYWTRAHDINSKPCVNFNQSLFAYDDECDKAKSTVKHWFQWGCSYPYILHHSHKGVLFISTADVKIERSLWAEKLASEINLCLASFVFCKQSVIPFDDANAGTPLSKYVIK